MDSSIINSIIFGGLITGLFSWIFYMKSAKELEDVSSKLDDRMQCMLIGMENAKLAELQKDDKGNIVGVKFTFRQKDPLEAKTGVLESTVNAENKID